MSNSSDQTGTVLPAPAAVSSRSFRRPARRRGAATIEMALVAPFVILLVLGSIEFSRMMMVKQALTNAAREGCREATLATTQDHVMCADLARERLKGTIRDYSNPDVVRISFSPAFDEVPDSGTLIVTLIEVDCADVSWLPPMFFSGARIRASSSMHRE